MTSISETPHVPNVLAIQIQTIIPVYRAITVKHLQLILDLLNLLSHRLSKLPEDVRLALDLITLGRGHATLGQNPIQAGKLLRNVVVAAAQLLEDADIVLGVCKLRRVGQLLDHLLRLGEQVSQGGTASDLGHDGIERVDRPGRGVETTTRKTVRASLFVDPCEESLLVPAAVVLDSLSASGGVPLDGRVGGDALVFGERLVGLGVDLGDDDAALANKVGREGLVDGGKGLAVCKCQRILDFAAFQLTATPRRSKGDEDVFVLANRLGERLIGQHENIARQLSLLLGLDTRLLGDESCEAVKVAAGLVILGRIALAIEELEGWVSLDAEPLANALLRVAVDLCDLDLVLRMLQGECELFVHGGELLAVAAPRGEELDESGLPGVEDHIVEVLGDEVQDGRLGRGRGREGGEDEVLDEHDVNAH